MLVALGAIRIPTGSIPWLPRRRIHRGLSTSRLHLRRILSLVADFGALSLTLTLTLTLSRVLTLTRILCVSRSLVLAVIEPLSMPGVLTLPRALALSHARAATLAVVLALTVGGLRRLIWTVLTGGRRNGRTDPGRAIRAVRTVRECSGDLCRAAGPVRGSLGPRIRVLRIV